VTLCYAQWSVEESDFFKHQINEVEEWLEAKGLEQYFLLEELVIDSNLLTLNLLIKYDCQDAGGIWKGLKRSYLKGSNSSLEEKLFDTFIYIMEVKEKQGVINIYCEDEEEVSILLSHDGKQLIVDEHIETILGYGGTEIPISEVKNIYHIKKDTLTNISVSKVRQDIGNFLYDYYKTKGTKFLWSAKIDTSKTYKDELIYEVSKLSNEVIEDGFFEKLKLKFKIVQKATNVEVDFNIIGKYGSGVIFEPKREDYKLMETKYPEELQEYEEDIRKKIEEFIRFNEE